MASTAAEVGLDPRSVLLQACALLSKENRGDKEAAGATGTRIEGRRHLWGVSQHQGRRQQDEDESN